MMVLKNYVRIRDLPEEQRAPFFQWLRHQACPVLLDVPDDEQDAAYAYDYLRWLRLEYPNTLGDRPQ